MGEAYQRSGRFYKALNGTPHIAVNPEPGEKTLCGRTITEEIGWKTIMALAGDECRLCVRQIQAVEESPGKYRAADLRDLFEDTKVLDGLPKRKPMKP